MQCGFTQYSCNQSAASRGRSLDHVWRSSHPLASYTRLRSVQSSLGLPTQNVLVWSLYLLHDTAVTPSLEKLRQERLPSVVHLQCARRDLMYHQARICMLEEVVCPAECVDGALHTTFVGSKATDNTS